jgi:hypothetical protein
LVVLFPFLLNGAELLNILKSAPVLRYSNLETGIVAGPLPGSPVIDPNLGVTSEALGRRSADELIHGKVPWWNPDIGIGLPLAGEMQPAPFYPLTILELLPNGQMLIDVLVQTFAGVFTLLLLRRLGLGRLAAVTGAILFECNGTSAWLSAQWAYPLPLLPLLLYGVELTLGRPLRERILGSVVVAAAVFISITAAMIEISYLDGLLCVGWALVRLAQAPAGTKRAGAARLVFGAGIGLAIATAPLIAFVDYLRVSYVGMHAGGIGDAHLVPQAVPQTFLPYIWGPIFYFNQSNVSGLWGSVGGYSGIALVLLAACGCFGRNERGLRLLLAFWIFLTFGATIGVPGTQPLVGLLPGLKYVAYFRYFDGSREFALAVLAALFVQDVVTDRAGRWVRYGAATAFVVLLFGWGMSNSSSILPSMFALTGFKHWFWGSILFGGVTICAIWLAAGLIRSPLGRGRALAAIVALEAALNFLVPTLANPRDGHVADGSIAFMHEHLGLQRMYGLGPVWPNYGAFFDVAEINHNQLPVSSAWVDYVRNHLDPFIDPISFTGDIPGKGPGVLGRDEVLRKNLAAFEGVGVKYVVSWAGSNPLQSAFDLPVLGPQPVQPLRLSEVPGIRIELGAVPVGRVSAIGIFQGNYTGTADGRLELKVCSGKACAEGRRALSESPNNRFFVIKLNRPLLVLDGKVSIAARQTGAAVSDAVWLFSPTPDTRERLLVGGREMPGLAASVRVLYGSSQTAVPSDQQTGYAVSVWPGESIRTTLSGGALPAGLVDAIGVAHDALPGGTAGRIRLRACDAGRCSHAERAARGSASDGFLWFFLDRPFRIGSGKLDLDFTYEGGAVPAAFWVSPDASGEVASLTVGREQIRGQALRLKFDAPSGTDGSRLVYSDDLVDVDELPAPASYFSANGCALAAQSRERVEARCARPSTLIRRELYMPGWTAVVRGGNAVVSPAGEIFQSVALGAGESSVVFDFTPPGMDYGYAFLTLGLLTLAYQLFAYVRLSLPRRDTRAAGAAAQQAALRA